MTANIEETFSDPYIGPVKQHVPQMYWPNISEETLKSYIVGTYESGKKLREIRPDVPVIVRQFRCTVYDEVLENLTEAGKLVVQQINPWLLVTLIDIEDFDKVICHSSNAESHYPDGNNNQKPEGEKSSAVESQSHTEMWTKAPTLLLLDKYRKSKDLLDAGKIRKNSLWRKISEKLCNTGYNFTEGQVSGRWKTLCRLYKEVKDGRRKSGAGRKDFPYYADLDQILGRDPAITPQVTLTSTTTAAAEESASAEKKSSNDSDSETEECASSKSKLVKRRKSQASEIVNFLESYVSKQEQQHNQELEERRRMHQEKMEILKSLANDLKK